MKSFRELLFLALWNSWIAVFWLVFPHDKLSAWKKTEKFAVISTFTRSAGRTTSNFFYIANFVVFVNEMKRKKNPYAEILNGLAHLIERYILETIARY